MKPRMIGVLVMTVLAVATASAQRGGGDNQPGRKWSRRS